MEHPARPMRGGAYRPGVLALSLLTLTTACSGDGNPSAPAPRPLTPVPVDATGRLRVVARYEGPPPAARRIGLHGAPECGDVAGGALRDESLLVHEGGVQNVIVHLAEGLSCTARPLPAGHTRLEQRGCAFVPHVVAMSVAQELEVTNGDPLHHNVRLRSRSGTWNFSLPRENAARRLRLPLPEIGIRVGCDIHPWMNAWIAVFDHPYFAVTGRDGNALLEQVPAGEYVVEGWHERLGTARAAVRVVAGRTTRVVLRYPGR